MLQLFLNEEKESAMIKLTQILILYTSNDWNPLHSFECPHPNVTWNLIQPIETQISVMEAQ
jgi:hypothetical protein